jgi:hypothetical protein
MVQPYFIPPPLVKLKPQFPLFKFFLPATQHLVMESLFEVSIQAGLSPAIRLLNT